MSQGTSLGHEQPSINRHLHPVALSGLRQKWKGRLWSWTDSLFPSAEGTGWFRNALHTLRVIIKALPLWLSHWTFGTNNSVSPPWDPLRDLDELVKAEERLQHCPSSPKHLYQLTLKTEVLSDPCECSGLANSHPVRAASLWMLQFALSFRFILS